LRWRRSGRSLRHRRRRWHGCRRGGGLTTALSARGRVRLGRRLRRFRGSVIRLRRRLVRLWRGFGGLRGRIMGRRSCGRRHRWIVLRLHRGTRGPRRRGVAGRVLTGRGFSRLVRRGLGLARRRPLEPSARAARCRRRRGRRLATARRPHLRRARNLRQIVGERRGTFAAVGIVLAQEPGEAADPGIPAKALRAFMAARPGAVRGKQRGRRLRAEILAPGGARWERCMVLSEDHGNPPQRKSGRQHSGAPPGLRQSRTLHFRQR